jgi:FlaA1/EpsC-like NDP-sugar epimerase
MPKTSSIFQLFCSLDSLPFLSILSCFHSHLCIMNSTKQQRVAIIGCGAMGLEHIRNIKLIENVSVAAIVDSNERARDEAKELLDEECLILSTIKELDPDMIDSIVVATPNYSHIEILRIVIKWKKHLLVEKVCDPTHCIPHTNMSRICQWRKRIAHDTLTLRQKLYPVTLLFLCLLICFTPLFFLFFFSSKLLSVCISLFAPLSIIASR